MPETIVSSDTRRDRRLPPGQVQTFKWPVLHAGDVPPFDPDHWDLTIFPRPMVDRVVRLTWDDVQRLPRVQVFADMHCVTRWSKLDNLWAGVPTTAIRDLVTIDPSATHVMVHGESGFSTNLPLDDFFADDVLLATHHDGQLLAAEHGYPLRLVVPRLYAWKSAKWVRGIEFMAGDRPGYWEEWPNGGYHLRGDPWAEQRHRDDLPAMDAVGI
jgi:DMSO/TMAO reductase YedYZ molybdopterin-dependent catalytic subunit